MRVTECSFSTMHVATCLARSISCLSSANVNGASLTALMPRGLLANLIHAPIIITQLIVKSDTHQVYAISCPVRLSMRRVLRCRVVTSRRMATVTRVLDAMERCHIYRHSIMTCTHIRAAVPSPPCAGAVAQSAHQAPQRGGPPQSANTAPATHTGAPAQPPRPPGHPQHRPAPA